MQVKLEQGTVEVTDKQSRLPHLIDALMTLSEQGMQVFNVKIENYLASKRGEEPTIIFTTVNDAK